MKTKNNHFINEGEAKNLLFQTLQDYRIVNRKVYACRNMDKYGYYIPLGRRTEQKACNIKGVNDRQGAAFIYHEDM